MSDRKKLYVAKLNPAKTTNATLRKCFSNYGELVDCKVVLDPSTRASRGFGYVTFRNVADAEQALAEMNQQELDDSVITVEVAKDQTNAFAPFRHARLSIPVAAAAAAGGGAPGPITYPEQPFDNANKTVFFTLCERLDAIGRAKGSLAKTSLLFDEQWVKYLQGQSWYPVLRLVFPEFDRERPKYHLKAQALGKLLVNAMQGQGRDFAARLLNWKDPGKANGGVVGDFCNVLREVLVERQFSTKPLAVRLTVGEVNALLDRLSLATGTEERQQVINDVLAKCSVPEVCWFAKIVLKDLSCGLHHGAVLRRYHPDAMQAMENHGDLRKCLAELNDPKVRHQFKVELFSVTSPMLARITRMDQATVGMGDFVIENKYDGDRMLIHIDKTQFPPQIKLFTRNGTDYTARYGSPLLFGQLLQAVRCERCILDGEMLAWDDTLDGMLDFGQTTTVAMEMNSPQYDGKRWLLYMCFDALLIEDGRGGSAILTQEPLRTRRARLKSIFTPMDKRVELAEALQVVTTTDLESRHQLVMQELDKVILCKGEGLILKALSSPYVGGETGRNLGHWVKVKPEHVNGLAEELDMVVLGGYYPDSKRRVNDLGDPSVFLLGVPSPTHPGRFLSAVKVGTGYSLLQLKELRDKLRPHLVRTTPQTMPPHFTVPTKRLDLPDVWLAQAHSVVLQVTGSELVPSEAFEAGYTLRFPRVSRIRYDKSVNECTTFAELKRLAVDFATATVGGGGGGGGLHGAKRAADVNRLDAHKRANLSTKKKRPHTQVLGLGGTRHLTDIAVTSQALRGHMFYVFPNTACEGLNSKQHVEVFITQHGGGVVQVPSGKHELFLIASAEVMRHPTQQLRNLKSSGKLNVMRVEFVVDVVNNHSPGDGDGLASRARFEDYLVMSDATRKGMEHELDEFGDHFEQDADVYSLERCMLAVKQPFSSTNQAVYQQLLDDADDPLATSFNLFRGLVAWFPDPDACDLEMLVLRMHGGRVAPGLESTVTHVFFHGAPPSAAAVVASTKQAWHSLPGASSNPREPFWLRVGFVTECAKAATPLPWEHFGTLGFEV